MTTSLSRIAGVLMVLGASNIALAESPKTTRSANPAEVVKRARQTAEAPVPPLLERKIDPLEAALSQAMALSAAPVVPAKLAAAATPRRDGLESLSRHAEPARDLGLERTRNRLLPTGEAVIRLDVQPLEMKVVSKLVKGRLAQIHYCHESLVARGLTQGGQVNMHFVIEPRGYVSSVAVTAGGTDSDELERCMARQIRGWKFPAADAPTVVDYPIVFDIAGSTLAQ